MFRPHVYLHYKREDEPRIPGTDTEVIVPVEYPKNLTEMDEIFDYGYEYDEKYPVKGFRLARVTVKAFPGYMHV